MDYFKMLLGQLKMLSSLSQPGAEPVLLLLFEVLCVWWGERVETMTGFSSDSRYCVIFLVSPLSGAGRAWLSYPPIISRGSEYHGKSHVSPSFLEAVKFPLSQQNSGSTRYTTFKGSGSSSAGQPLLAAFYTNGNCTSIFQCIMQS